MKHFTRLLPGLLCGAVFLAGGPVPATAGLIGATFFDQQLLKINATTSEGSAGPALSDSVLPYGLAFRGNQLFTFDAGTNRIRQIDRFTGAVSTGVDLGVGLLVGEGDLAFRRDGIGFLSSALTPDFAPANDLFRFDLGLGTAVRVGTTSVPLDGMVFVGNTLYGIGQEAGAQLYIVNQSTAALTSVGSLGFALGSPVSALTADSHGALYAALDDRLYTVDRATGLALAVDDEVLALGYGSVSGLAFTPVPEPATYGLAGVAMLALVGALRRRRTRASVAPGVG